MSGTLEKKYWLVSVPKTASHGFSHVQKTVEKSGWGVCSKFVLPELRIGTLDTLMTLSDDLNKQDNYIQSVTVKLAKQLASLRLDQEEEGNNNNNEKLDLDELLTVNQAYLDPWLKKFRWDAGRWDYEKNSLNQITSEIVKIADRVDKDLRHKAGEWQQLNRSLKAAKSVASGSVLMRDLAGVLKESQVVNTDSVCTLMVVVQKGQLEDWWNTYESLEVDDLAMAMGGGPGTGRVVMPKSSQVILEDYDSALVSVVVLRRFQDQVKAKLREMRFTPREYTFEKNAGKDKEKDIAELSGKRAGTRLELLKYCQIHFAEVFSCWVHLKAIRVWVESVLRFSLPADFDVTLIRVTEGRYEQKIRKALADLFGDLASDGVLSGGGGDNMQAITTLALDGGLDEMFPYVFSELLIALGRN